MNVHYITFRASAQATESDDRVRKALSLFLLDNEISQVITEGHFGNPIILLEGQIKGEDCTRFLDLVRSELSEEELEKLRNERCERIDDDCSLHIRFDKQAAYEGKVRLARASSFIDVKIKLKAYPANFNNAIEASRMIF